MSDIDNNDITIREESERPRLAAAEKLIVLWNLLFELVVGVPFIILMADFGASTRVFGGLLFVCAHTAASAVSFKRYKRKYGVSAPKFVSLNALPLFLIGAVMYVAGLVSKDLGITLLFGVFCVCFLGYSVVYASLLSAVIGIMHAVGKRKERL